MSDAKHTPGPWRWNECGDLDPVFTCEMNQGCGFISWNDGAASDADRNLIAAAPDLLAALEAVVRVADRDTPEFREARAAIAKAKGTQA